jgi:predicted NBD/HSP70 family sugar kinase
MSPTTVGARVDELVTYGFLRETGVGASRGGRRPRMLELDTTGGFVASVDLGARHATLGLFDLSGGLPVSSRQLDLDIADGPSTVLSSCLGQIRQMLAEEAHQGRALRAVAIGLPGPVDFRTSCLVSPSRMPGWNRANPAEILSRQLGVPVLADNDANLMALGERFVALQPGAGRAEPDHLIFLKAGSSIGCGVIAWGRLYRGVRGMAGDLSHVSVPGAPPVACACGRVGCLDAVAGGSAIVADLLAQGVSVSGPEHLVRLAHDGHPATTHLLREAGTRTGVVLSTVVSFFNPRHLVLGGHLSQTDAFVAGVRSALYAHCLPFVTDQLDISVSLAGPQAGIIGGAAAALDKLFDPAEVNSTIARLRHQGAFTRA